MDKKKIIIDTDIGDDADDALAICLALKSVELDVVGITTVFRNTDARAKIAVRLLQLLNREDIPVYAGFGKPLIADADLNAVPIQLLPGMENLSYRKEKNAVEFVYNKLISSDGDITLVTIGPLTNIAMLIRIYPEVTKKIREIVMMGGAYYMHYNEWNIRCDPEAASIVFESGIPIRAIGLDVTLKCPVNDVLYNDIKNHGKPVTDLLAELLLCYKNKRGRHTFLHDPMAIFAVYDQKLIDYRGEDIVVELHGSYTRGTTFNRCLIGKKSERQNVLCAKYIRASDFIEEFRNRILTD